MLNFALIFSCLLVGMLLKKTRRLPENAPLVLNAFIIHLSLPAVVLTQLPAMLARQSLTTDLLAPILMPWALFILAVFFFRWVGLKRGWSKSLIGALSLTAGLGNTSFVGFPLLEALVGAHAISIGVLLDQLGSFLVLATLGLVVAVGLSPSHSRCPSWKQTAQRVFSFPPFLALLVAFAWVAGGYTSSTPFELVLNKVAATLVPLALVAVGLQLNLSPVLLRQRWKPLALGLGFKLVVSPLFFLLVFRGILQLSGEIIHITLLEASMAPMITAAVVANQFDLDGEMANLMVGIGIPLSLLTVPAWHYLLLGL